MDSSAISEKFLETKEKIKKCALQWKSTCAALAVLSVIGIATRIYVPLWVIPLGIWLIGLYVCSQHSAEHNLVQKAFVEVSKKKIQVKAPEISWNSFLIFQFNAKNIVKDFKRPYDSRKNQALAKSAADALYRFGASTAFAHRDTISVFYTPSSSHPINGSHGVTDTAASMSAYLSVRFVANLRAENFEDWKEQGVKALENPDFYFDVDIKQLNSWKSAVVYFDDINGRMACFEAVRDLATLHYVPAEIKGLCPADVIKMLEKERNVSYDEMPMAFRHGQFIKRRGSPDEKGPLRLSIMPLLLEKDANSAYEFLSCPYITRTGDGEKTPQKEGN